MKDKMKIYLWCLVAALSGTALAWGQPGDVPPRPAEADNGVEVLTRGPVHEAFAETISFDPEPGVVVAKAVPEPIEELPPEQKPAGTNVEWIPGYWAWDDERTDYLWVSGTWRSLPPGRQWVSGYWGPSGNGSQWTSGYWADAQASEIDYLPEPPQSVEAGPNVDAPSADHTWLPGCWVWQQNRYAWRAGYWGNAQSNWIWIPAHYVWTPRGYVFVDGYYDYSVARRGVLYAPVYINSNVYSRRGFSYSPALAINAAVFGTHLFLRPSYGHYYFGDYYGSNYASSGYLPWFSYYSGRRGYDPFYAHQHWHHRNDQQWQRRLESDHAHRHDHEDARPPRTWTAQRERSTRDGNQDKSLLVAASLEDMAKDTEAPVRFKPVAKAEREQLSNRNKEVRKGREQRQKLEAEVGDRPSVEPKGTSKPVKVKLPKSSIVAQSADKLEKDDAPPKSTEAPEADIKIEPKPRKPRGNGKTPIVEPKVTGDEPRPTRPVTEPKPPKVESKPNVEAKPPKAEPKPPKVEAKPPKVESKKPQTEAKPPKAEAKPPKVEAKPPKVERKPKTETKPPKVEVKKPQVEAKPPKAEAKPPKVESKPDRPKVESREKPQRKPDAPRGGANNGSKGGTKGEGKKDKPRN